MDLTGIVSGMPVLKKFILSLYENWDGDTLFDASNMSGALANDYVTEFHLTASDTADNS
jgi:hypothetical protein